MRLGYSERIPLNPKSAHRLGNIGDFFFEEHAEDWDWIHVALPSGDPGEKFQHETFLCQHSSGLVNGDEVDGDQQRRTNADRDRLTITGVIEERGFRGYAENGFLVPAKVQVRMRSRSVLERIGDFRLRDLNEGGTKMVVLLSPDQSTQAEFQPVSFLVSTGVENSTAQVRKWDGKRRLPTLYGSIQVEGWHGYVQDGYLRDEWVKD